MQVIYQELNDAPDLSVAENVLLGHLPRRKGRSGASMVDWPAAYRRAGELLAAMGADIDAARADADAARRTAADRGDRQGALAPRRASS